MCIACGFPNLIHHDGAGGSDLLAGSASAGQPVGTIAQLADYLVNGYWQFNGTVAHHFASNTITYNLGNLTATEQSLAVAALNLWHDVANITFVQTTRSATRWGLAIKAPTTAARPTGSTTSMLMTPGNIR